MKLKQGRKSYYQGIKNRFVIASAFAFLVLILNINTNLVFAEETQNESNGQEKVLGVLGADLLPVNPQTGDQTLFYYELEPGNTFSDKLWLINRSEKVNTLSIYPVHEIGEDDGGILYSNIENDNEEVSKWVTTTKKALMLNPEEFRQIDFTITIPEDTPLGIYKGGFAMQKIIPAKEGQVLNSAFRKIRKVELNITDNPKLFVKKSVLQFQPTMYFWIALGFFVLSVIYYFIASKKKNNKSK